MKVPQLLQPICYPNSSNINASLLGWWHSWVRPGQRLCPLGSPSSAWPAWEGQESPTSTAQQVPRGLGKGLCYQGLFWDSVNRFYPNLFIINSLFQFMSYPCKTKDKLQRFLQSMTSKSGKLRALVRDLKKGYSTASISPSPGYNYWMLQFTSVKFLGSFSIHTVPGSHGSCYLPHITASLGPGAWRASKTKSWQWIPSMTFAMKLGAKGRSTNLRPMSSLDRNMYTITLPHTHIHKTYILYMCLIYFAFSM